MAGTSTRSAILTDPAAQIPFPVASDGAVFAAVGDDILGTRADTWTLSDVATIALTDSSGTAVDLTAGGLQTNGGTATFNGDGRSDIRSQGSRGAVASQEVPGLSVVDSGFNGFAGSFSTAECIDPGCRALRHNLASWEPPTVRSQHSNQGRRQWMIRSTRS